MQTIELTFERVIPAPPRAVFDGWLSPKIPGTPWNRAEKLILDARADGLFFWHANGVSHYGRFTEVARPERIRHTWVSPYTLGLESEVTVTFTRRGAETVMVLAHSGLPDSAEGRRHELGWNHFMDLFQNSMPDAGAEE